MNDTANDKSSKVTCNACGRRITERQASIFTGTANGERERHHLTCWPFRLKAVEIQERLAP